MKTLMAVDKCHGVTGHRYLLVFYGIACSLCSLLILHVALLHGRL